MNLDKHLKKLHSYQDNGLSKFDWLLFASLAGLCYFTMPQGDILHTCGSSFAYTFFAK